MAEMLTVDPERCTGCKVCELACSMKKRRFFSPAASSIRVMTFTEAGHYVPVVCQQCDPAPCVRICPTNALIRDGATQAVQVEEERCIACKMCMIACPFGAISFSAEDGYVAKCDLCDGQPECVRFCEPKAIEFKPAEVAMGAKQRNWALKLVRALREED